MDFNALHEMIPYAKGGKEKVLRMSPYPNITLALPGRHAEDTTPKGGDFVVMVDDSVFKTPNHQFTHDDIFKDIQKKYDSDSELTGDLMTYYYAVILGRSPGAWDTVPNPISGLQDHIWEGTIHPGTFLAAVQCLAVAEHRRYKQHEAKFGGRYLPFRAAAGIADGKWTAEEATTRTRRAGRLGVEWLESERGTPDLTKELMGK